MNPLTTIIYCYPAQGYDGYAARFVGCMARLPCGVGHKTIIVVNGGAVTGKVRALFSPLGAVDYVLHDNSGWDIGAFQAALKHVTTEAVLLMGAPASVRQPGWLARLQGAWVNGGPGLYGTIGSYQYGLPHLATTGLLMPASLLLEYPWRVVTQEQRSDFEHGHVGITNRALVAGLPVRLVTWSGVWRLNEMRQPNGLHRGDQSDLLTYYTQTDIWDSAPFSQRAIMQARVDGKTNV